MTEPRTPDLIGALPGLRTFLATREDGLDATVARYSYVPGENVADHLGFNNAWMGAAWNYTHPDQTPEVHESPTPGCECGFYAWYPWAQGRYSGLTPIDADPRRRVWAKPHPAVRDAVVSWWGRACTTAYLEELPGRRMSEDRLGVSTPAIVLGVLDVYGKVVLHDHGVRAAKATVRALVDPMSAITLMMPPLEDWHEILSHGWAMSPYAGMRDGQIERAVPQVIEATGRRTWDVARALGLPVLDLDEALRLESEWSQLRPRIEKNRHGGLPG